MKDLLQLMEASSIKVILMDREFVGKKWFQWLDRQGVGFVARIKNNTIVSNRLAGEYTSTQGRKPVKRLRIWGQNLFFGSKKIVKGRTSHLYVVSNRFTGKEALKLYRKRWSIELLFSHLKRKGFNLEDTHMTDNKKIEKLISIISLSFLFTFGWGCYLRDSQKQTSASKRKSLFRLGLEDLLHALTNLNGGKVRWKSFIRWLKSCQLNEIFDV